ncbi:unnamed protein product [Moneuplotes crassus]|uniref:C2H2-type domain-containing protein n=1 Tax=Euplotes crassus TaxID=5936 RepID=A0AAD2D3D8_EUPCR|nr:unnamed protein product [Moneuplotes crassus]
MSMNFPSTYNQKRNYCHILAGKGLGPFNIARNSNTTLVPLNYVSQSLILMEEPNCNSSVPVDAQVALTNRELRNTHYYFPENSRQHLIMLPTPDGFYDFKCDAQNKQVLQRVNKPTVVGSPIFNINKRRDSKFTRTRGAPPNHTDDSSGGAHQNKSIHPETQNASESSTYLETLVATYKSNPRQKLCTCSLTSKQAHLVDKVMTINNLEYLHNLRSFNYGLKLKNSPSTGRPIYFYVCKFKGGCHKEFERSWNLLDHYRMHEGIKPYSCPICQKKFTQKGNMNKHINTH